MEPEDQERQEAMDGSPAVAEDKYYWIKFQTGPIQEYGVNGTTIETLIEVLVKRLEGFNAGPFRCRENSLAITDLQSAQNWLHRRTMARQAQGVEGTNQPHV